LSRLEVRLFISSGGKLSLIILGEPNGLGANNRIVFIRIIKILKNETTADRLVGKMPRKHGYRDASITINNYLNFKSIVLDKILVRTQILQLTNINWR
jgi:hypothetical protein